MDLEPPERVLSVRFTAGQFEEIVGALWGIVEELRRMNKAVQYAVSPITDSTVVTAAESARPSPSTVESTETIPHGGKQDSSIAGEEGF